MALKLLARDAVKKANPGIKLRIEAKLGILDDLRLVAYRGHGTRRSLHLKGRLIEATGESGTVAEKSTLLGNLLMVLRRLDSDEIPGARLSASFRGQSYDVYTDNEGFFQLNLYVEQPLEPGWHDVPIELVESVKEGARSEVVAEALVPSEDAEFGVVSDIDDTVIKSSAYDKLEYARLTLFHDAASRTPFDGVAALYRALAGGPGDEGMNPIFYLSRSGWNLYDLCCEFFEIHGIPRGPMFLRDLSLREEKSSALGSMYHKLARIRDLLQLYPLLPFVLIGDTGQHDIERYWQIAVENPGRIRAVYLRDVAGPAREREIKPLAEDLKRRGVPTLLGDDSAAFAEHMHAEGLIGLAAVEQVRATLAPGG